MTLQAQVDFGEDPRLLMRQMFIEPEFTDAVRLIHGPAIVGLVGMLSDSAPFSCLKVMKL